MKSVEELRSYFKNDAFATSAGIVIEQANQDSVVCSVKINDNHLNATGHVQGGLIFTLADFAFAVISNKDRLGSVTASSSIQFVGSPKGRVLEAKAVCARQGRSVSHYHVTVTDDTGVLVAEVLSTGFRSVK